MRGVFLLNKPMNVELLGRFTSCPAVGVAVPLCFIPPPLSLLTHYQIHSSCLNNTVLNLHLMLGM